MCYACVVARTIAQRDLRNDNAKVIDAVVAGETFVVTAMANRWPNFAPYGPFAARSSLATKSRRWPAQRCALIIVSSAPTSTG